MITFGWDVSILTLALQAVGFPEWCAWAFFFGAALHYALLILLMKTGMSHI